MRLQGRVIEWNDERGFGFIIQNGTSERTFLHISAVRKTKGRPLSGSLVTYEIRRDDKGRLQAVAVRFSNQDSTISASVYKIVLARDALRPHPEFQCTSEKNSCSKMASCAEALFHQERCKVPEMDGDGDGIPCEQQWCN